MTRKFKVKLQTIKGNKYVFDWNVPYEHVYNASHIADLFLSHSFIEVSGEGKDCHVVPCSAIDNFEIIEVTTGPKGDHE